MTAPERKALPPAGGDEPTLVFARHEPLPAWLLPLRLLIFVLLFGIVLALLRQPPQLITPLLGYGFCTLVFLGIVTLHRRRSMPMVLRLVLAVQIVWEVFLEAGIVHQSGNLSQASPYNALFLLTIVSASLVYRLIGTLAIATAASLFYSFAIWGTNPATLPWPWDFSLRQILAATGDDSFAVIFVHICVFYITAFISGYLAERLQHKGEELAETSEQLQKARLDTDDILHHLYSGLLTIDRAGKVIYFNQAAQEILGYRSPEIQGRDFRRVFGHRMPDLVERLQQVLESGRMEPRFELVIVSRSGRQCPVGFTLSPLKDPQGNPRGVIGVFQDLTEIKLLEDRIRTSDRLAAVGELSAGIAHEIRNPLAAIAGSVEVLRKELQLTGDEKRLLDLVIRESERLNQILSEFLHFARIRPTLLTAVDLASVTRETIEALKRQPLFSGGSELGPRRKIEMKLQSDPALAPVWGEKNQIMQILLNLLTNAAEAMTGKGRAITVRLSNPPEADWVAAAIEDEGCGMTPEQKEKIFEPFYTTKAHGTGLGLSIVHRLVTNLHGRLEVESAPGRGTTVTVYFQKYEKSPQEKPEPSDSSLFDTPAEFIPAQLTAPPAKK